MRFDENQRATSLLVRVYVDKPLDDKTQDEIEIERYLSSHAGLFVRYLLKAIKSDPTFDPQTLWEGLYEVPPGYDHEGD